MKITALSLALLSILFTADCRKTEKKKNGGAIALLLLAASRNSLTGSQTSAEFMANSSSVSGEDSAESGSMGISNTKAVSFSGTSTGGTISNSSETFDCALGGTVSFEGTQDFTADGTDFYNRTTTLTNGSRKITYDNCAVSASLTINSGSITFTQLTADSGSTTMKTQVTSGTTASGTLQRTLSNLKASVKGSMTVTVSGRRGTGTGTIEHDHTLVLTSRVRNWTLTNGKVSKPVLQSRQGTLTGTTTINGKAYTISKSLDVTIE